MRYYLSVSIAKELRYHDPRNCSFCTVFYAPDLPKANVLNSLEVAMRDDVIFNKECKVDLDENLNALGRIFDIANNKSNLPVAFATNSMYVMVRNGQYIQGIREIIEGDLLPRAMEKSEHLHAEGIAQLAYSLAQTEIWDEKAWALIRE